MNKKYRKLRDEGWEIGGDNTFADLGLDDSEKLQAKAFLRAAVLSRIAALEITQLQAARRLGVPQPKLSNLMTNERPRGFSSDKLMEFATKLGLDVQISVKPSRNELGRIIVTGALRTKGTSHKRTRRAKKAA